MQLLPELSLITICEIRRVPRGIAGNITANLKSVKRFCSFPVQKADVRYLQWNQSYGLAVRRKKRHLKKSFL